MRKHLIALLGFLAGAMVYYIKAPARETASVHDEFHQEEFVSTSQAAPSSKTSASPAIPVETIVIDPSKEEKKNVPGLPRGMQLAPQVRAIPVEDYRPEQGKILMKKNGFAFFRSGVFSAEKANVVYDQRLNTFHPLTATIKITNVDETKRAENLRKWDEYHYNADLGIQYIQSTHADLLEDFEEVISSGSRATLEIIQAVYQSQ